VIGTPGRVLDHLLRRTLTLDDVEILVLDEADRMLSMGFYPDMRKVKSYLPKRRINGYLFSATFPPHVLRLAGEFLHEPETLSLSRDHVHVTDVIHVYYRVPAVTKDRCLVRILEVENPASAIIFCNTKKMVHYVNVVLQRFGWDADELSADLGQNARERVLQRVRDGKLRLLVATDVAARGIDISDLSLVILYSLPQAHDHYIHRAGRTGRAGEGGTAVSLVTPLEEIELKKRARRHNIQLMHKEPPTDEEVEKRVAERLQVMLEEKYRGLSNLERERMQRFLPLSKMLAEMGETAAMLLDRFYQETLHKPLYQIEEEVKPPPSAQRERRPRKRNDNKSRSSRPRRRRRN
jgi:ATP-dependent RNA helicase DeaD